jgi:autoinducer 2-degrading protein
MPYVVFVTLDVRPNRIDRFVDAITDNAIASVRDEDGCLVFDVHQDESVPTRFYLYEIYADEQAFRLTHQRARHYVRWREAAAAFVVESKSVFAHTVRFGPIDV